jgi:hypothetical protein
MSKKSFYLHKYLKYKNKYIKSLFKLKDNIKMNNIIKKFNNYKNDMILHYDKTIHKLDFSHDFPMLNLKKFKLIDFIKNQSYIINEIKINPELFIKHKIMNDFSSNYQEINLNDISNNIVIFDNGTQTYEIAQNLYYLFNLTQYTTTFIGDAEKLLIQSNLEKIDTYFDFSSNQIKNNYLEEAINIGVSLNMNEIINYNFLRDLNQENLVIELKKINRIYQEYLSNPLTKLKTIKKQFLIDSKNDFFDWLKNFIENKDNIRIYQDFLNLKENNDLNFLNLQYFIYGIKYSRDSYYLEEIKEIQKSKNIIFITLDLILAFRCIQLGIKVMNFYQGKFKFLLYPKDDKIYFINNPFEMIIKENINENFFRKINHIEKRKDIIQKILNNPLLVMDLKKNNKINLKYLNYNIDFTNYDAFLFEKFYKYYQQNNEKKKNKYFLKLKKAYKYCQDLFNLIENLEDKYYLYLLIGKFEDYSENLSQKYEYHLLLNQFASYNCEYHLIKDLVNLQEDKFNYNLAYVLSEK